MSIENVNFQVGVPDGGGPAGRNIYEQTPAQAAARKQEQLVAASLSEPTPMFAAALAWFEENGYELESVTADERDHYVRAKVESLTGNGLPDFHGEQVITLGNGRKFKIIRKADQVAQASVEG